MDTASDLAQLREENKSLKEQLIQTHRLRWVAESDAQLLRQQLGHGQEPVAEVIEKQGLFWKNLDLVLYADLQPGMKLYTHAQPCAKCAELELQLGTERLRLAACGVAAMTNTPASVQERIPQEHPYWSASYGDVCRAVDEQIALREENKRLNELFSVDRQSFVYLSPEERQPYQDILNKQILETLDMTPGAVIRIYPEDEHQLFKPDWTPTPENINALPPALRDYIHALATNCDPAGMVSENVFAKTNIKSLTAQCEKLERLLIGAKESLAAALSIANRAFIGESINPYALCELEGNLATIKKALP